MAPPIVSNNAWFSLEKQSAKGTPITLPTLKIPYSGGTRLKPRADTAQLNETDASRDEGVTYKQMGGAEGSPDTYLRDSNIWNILQAALGASTRTGSSPNWVDTITPANALSYYTFDQGVGGVLYERTEDAIVNGFTLRDEAGNPGVISTEVLGRIHKQLATDPGPAVAVDSSVPYNFNEVTVTLSGGATALVRNLELTYSNGAQLLQTDDFVPLDLSVGKRSVTVGFELYFTDLVEYNKFYYGTAAPTLPVTQVATIYTTDLTFDFPRGANNQITLSLPRISVEEFPVDPNPDGNPIAVPVRARAARIAGGVPPVLTATVKHQ